ncbi:MAG: GspE/PulE family protein [bacterium]
MVGARASGRMFSPAEETFLGELIEAGTVAEADRPRIEALRGASPEALAALLVTLGLLSERDLAQRMAAHLDLPLAAPVDLPETPLFAETLEPQFLRHARVLPMAETDEALTLAVADPFDEAARSAMAFFAQKDIQPVVATPAEILAAVDTLYAPEAGQADEWGELGAGGDLDVERLKELASEAPIIRLVNRIIADALDRDASDIHLETTREFMRVRVRVDGQLIDVEQVPVQAAAAVISRLKIMGNLDIAEKRLAQDGRFRLSLRGRHVDFRIATMPTMHGEAVALRLLDKDAKALDFGDLGFAPAMTGGLARLLDEPHGIILVTGPTGSGKTTTLYAALNRLNRPEREILTVEDPVEYGLDGINQVQVNPQIGHTFAAVLRSFLRHDPDILMVGEIRDAETAEIAVQAALTGHMVLSTLHTNDAVSAVSRLTDMGVEDYLLASVLRGVLAQRLVRRLCPECRELQELTPELERLFRTGPDQPLPEHIYAAGGCSRCQDTGYRGRTVIAELFQPSEAARRLIVARADAGELARQAEADGMAPMLRDGLAKVREGLTSVEEVLRATREG